MSHRILPGWTATLASWQQQRRRAAIAADDPAADLASMQATADAILATLDCSHPVHLAVAQAVLGLEPYWPLVGEGCRYLDGLWALDTAGVELALELWRAEREQVSV